MRIAIFIDSLAIGGAQKHIRQLACGLADSGDVVTLFVLNEVVEQLYQDPLEASGVTVCVIGKLQVITGIGLARSVYRLWRGHFDCVISVLFVGTIFGRLAAQLAGGVPVLTCLQARNVNFAWWQKMLLTATAQLTELTVSNSRSALPWASRHEGVDLRRSALIQNVVDPPKPLNQVPTWAQIGLPELEARRVIGSFGRLDHQKGYDFLLNALSLVPAEFRHDLAVVIFGEGPKRKELEAQRHKLALNGLVYFPGKRAEAIDLLPKLELYVQPSRFEGTSNAIMEALAAGVTVLATPVDGALDLQDIPGLLLAENNPRLWAALLVSRDEYKPHSDAAKVRKLYLNENGVLSSRYKSILGVVSQKMQLSVVT